MALSHVGKLVAEHACHFLLAVEIHEEPCEDVDVAARHGKGVDGGVEDNAWLETEGLRRNGGDDVGNEVVHVLGNFRILDHGQIGAHGHIELAAHLVFVLQGDAPEEEGPGLHRVQKGQAKEEQGCQGAKTKPAYTHDSSPLWAPGDTQRGRFFGLPRCAIFQNQEMTRSQV